MPAKRSANDISVSKLPATFFPRTMARLLPPAEVVARMSQPQMLAYIDQRARLLAAIKAEPVRFFQPHPGSGQELYAVAGDPGCPGEGKRVFGYLAGNKSGKTTVADVKLLERLAGRALWGDRTHTYKSPIRAAYFAEDFDSHKEVSLPNLFSWAPRGFLGTPVRNSQGHVVEITCSNGSILHFRTYDQGSEKAEGKDWDVVRIDEPPPRNVYTAIYRGLVAQNGVMFISATVLREPWLYDEIDQDYFFFAGGTIDDNVWLDKGAVSDFLSALTEDEREVRRTGRPSHLTGLIYKEFADAPPWVVPDHPVPPEAPVIMGVDPHERKPCHVAWGYLTPSSRIVWFDWALVGGSTKQIRAQLELIEQRPYHGQRACVLIMDPNRGSQRQIQYDTAQPDCWEQVFSEWGYNVVFANDDIGYGHKLMRDLLSVGRDSTGAILRTPTGEVAVPPGMVWMERCRGKKGPIYQMLRYAWEDWASRRMERDPKERPRDVAKDFPDIFRYTAAAALDYRTLRFGAPVLNMLGDALRDRREPHGYV